MRNEAASYQLPENYRTVVNLLEIYYCPNLFNINTYL